MAEFFPATHLQTIIQMTDGKLVRYRGQEAYFHFEEPSYDEILAVFGQVKGIARLLIGDATAFPRLEENTHIEVDGDDWVVGDWKTPGDGGIIWIALKRNLRL